MKEVIEISRAIIYVFNFYFDQKANDKQTLYNLLVYGPYLCLL